jgi:SAM-dependent methyltransferase
MSARSQFDDYARNYEETVNDSLGFLGVKVDYFTRVKVEYLLDLLKQRFGAAESVDLLDIGCGTGNSHAVLSGRVHSLAGTDISADCLDRAAERNPGVGYRHYNGARLPYGNASFDAAMAVCVLHHVPPVQRSAFADEMRRVLKPGGLAVIFEHNPLNPLTLRAVSNCEFDQDAVLLGMGETRRLLAAAGFADISARSILSIPSVGAATRKLDLALGRLALGAQFFVRATA